MTTVAQLRALSHCILDQANILADYLEANNIDPPSFEVDAPDNYTIPQRDPTYQARKELLIATKNLHDLALGPRESLRLLCLEPLDTLSLHFIHSFRLPVAVPLHNPISYEALTTATSTLAGHPITLFNLRRLVRHAITNNIFTEPKKGFVAHNRVSRLLREDRRMDGWTDYICTDFWQPVVHGVAALRKWPGSEDPKQCPMSMAAGREVNLWELLREDKGMQRRYDLMLEAHAMHEGFGVMDTVRGYPWGELGEGVVVDMGGAQGKISCALATTYPSLSFTVQDLPSTRDPSVMTPIPDDLSTRVILTTHDILTPQTVHGATAYLLRWVLHAFPDDICIDILRNLIPALKPGARIIINDGVLPDYGELDEIEEKAMRTMDLIIFVARNSRQRDVDDWRRLFTKADGRFGFEGAWRVEGSKMWFLEAVWRGGEESIVGVGAEGEDKSQGYRAGGEEDGVKKGVETGVEKAFI